MQSLSQFLKNLIKKQGSSVGGPVGNLLGIPLETLDQILVSRDSDWFLYYADTTDLVSPNTIVSLNLAEGAFNIPVLTAVGGRLEFGETSDGSYLYATVVDAPSDLGFTVTIESPNKQISVYTDETLIRRGANSLTVTINVSAGLTPLNIITTGGAANTTIIVPEDIRTTIASLIPSPPSWRNPIPIETNYIDPLSGNTGNALFWNNQPNVGGWGVYRTEFSGIAQINSVGVIENRYIITINQDLGSLPVPVLMRFIDSGAGIDGILGIADFIGVNSGTGETNIRIRSADEFIDLDTVSGTLLQSVTYRGLSDVARTGGTSGIRFVDTNVRKGQEYSYALDAYSSFDSSLRSEKSEIKSVIAGDDQPPGDITLLSFEVTGNTAVVTYHTPSDEDYLATHIYYDSGGSFISVAIDYGVPDVDDSATFRIMDSGTYYFPTIDQVGNEQGIDSGTSFFWSGVKITISGPPRVLIRQLSAAEKEALPLDPALWAVYELDAEDPDSPKSSLTLQYRTRDDSDWISVGGGSLPVQVQFRRDSTDNWIRVRAFDSDGLFSDELLFIHDFDNRPEVVFIDADVIPQSDIVDTVGTVDDDTQSLRWWIGPEWSGPTGSDPSVGSSVLIDNLDSNKVFNFTFELLDGQRKILNIEPFALLGGSGTAGEIFTQPFLRPPRSFISFQDRTILGAVQRTETIVSIRSVPEDAVIFKKVDPIVFGDVTEASASHIRGIDQLGVTWTDDQWNTYYDLRIVGGTGQGQTRQIVDTLSGDAVQVSPAFSVVPDTTSDFHIAERFRHYADGGLVTSGTVDTLIDSGKNWAPNIFIGKVVSILDGTGTGQEREVSANTATDVTVSPGWATPPDGTSRYRVEGQFGLTKFAEKDIIISFFSEIQNAANDVIINEDVRSVTVDLDSQPEIHSGSIYEDPARRINITITEVDDDVKFWELYARRTIKDRILRDSYVDPDGTTAGSHDVDFPVNVSWTTPGTEDTDGYYSILNNRLCASGTAPGGGIVVTQDIIQDDYECYSEIERSATGPATDGASVYVRANDLVGGGSDREYIEVRVETLGDETNDNVEIRIQRRDADVVQESLVLTSSFFWPAGVVNRLGCIVNSGTFTVWTEPEGGGLRTIHGSWNPTNAYNDTSHMRVGLQADAVNGSSDFWYHDTFTVNLDVEGLWPTIDGLPLSILNQDYLRFRGPPSITTVSFDVLSGIWNAIVVPYDSFNSAGPRLFFEIEIVDSGGAGGGGGEGVIWLQNVKVDRFLVDGGGFNKVNWTHHNSIDKPAGGNGTHHMRIWARRDDQTEAQAVDLTESEFHYLRPDGDVTTGSWTLTPLWSRIDEILSTGIDNIQSPQTIAEITRTFEVSLSSPVVTPDTSKSHKVRVLMRRVDGDPAEPGSASVSVTLKQAGGSDIASASFTAFPGAFQQKVLNLTQAQVDSITNYNTLNLVVSATYSGGTVFPSWVEVAQAEVQIGHGKPDARWVWLDSEDDDTFYNLDDVNNLPQLGTYGSFVHRVDPGWRYGTWFYRVELYDSGTEIYETTVSISGNFT